MKKTLLSMILLLSGCLSVSAQKANGGPAFNPHWYVEVQGGMQHTLGEVANSKLNSPNAQIDLGYNLTPIWGLRLSVNGWQSKGGITAYYNEPELSKEFDYKWNYFSPSLDVTYSLTNALLGFNPNRKVDFALIAGVGINVGFNNDEAASVHQQVLDYYSSKGVEVTDKASYMTELWDGSKVLAVGRFGAAVDIKVCERLTVGLEATTNFLNDNYNSKRVDNLDWYFNGLVGVKIAL